jgi:hypothetical protein
MEGSRGPSQRVLQIPDLSELEERGDGRDTTEALYVCVSTTTMREPYFNILSHRIRQNARIQVDEGCTASNWR